MALQFVSNQIKDSAIITAKIANTAVTAGKIDLTGSFDFSSGTLQAGSPSASSDVANKSYVDAVAQGLHFKDSVRAASTANLTLSGTQTVDGISLSAGNRILVKNQSSAAENGIWVVAAGAWSRSGDMDAGSEFPGAAFFVREGSVNADSGWVCTNDSNPSLGSDSIAFAQFTGAGQITAGNGLSKSGNTLSVNTDNSSIEISSDSLRVKALGISDAMLAGSISAGKLAGSIGNDKLSNSAVSFGGVSVSLGSSDATPAFDLADATNYPTSSLVGTISNAQLAGSIADSKLNAISTAGKVLLSALEIDGGTDIGADLADADLFIVDDGAAGTNRKSALSRVKKYIYSALSGDATATDSGALTIADNSVSLAKMAGLARGSVIYGDASGDPAALSAGTAGQLIQSNGTDISYISLSGDVTVAAGGAVTIANDAVEQAMIADDAVGADQLASNAVVTASIVNSNVTFAKAAFVPHQESFSGDGSTVAFNLTNRIATATWRQSIIVFRNGQKIKFNGSPSDASEYSISDNGSTTTVTLGAAPASGEDVTLFYIYE